jgi:endonuclease/exonuclease/phosphatase family metal-dependent hydrolase
MRVISWNMGLNDKRFAKPGMHGQAWHYLLGLQPDLAFLQETLPPTWVHGHGFLAAGAFNVWGSAIFSPRYPLSAFHPPNGSRAHALGAYLAFAKTTLPDGEEALLTSVHARADFATKRQLGESDSSTLARRSVGRPRVNDLVFAEVDRLRSNAPRFIAAGDWNTGRTQASATAGVEFFDRAKEKGWYDCVWDTFEREERTWFRAGDKLVQDDHVFCDPSLGGNVRDAWAASDAAEHLGLSDHAPLIVDIDVDAIAMTNLSDEPA